MPKKSASNRSMPWRNPPRWGMPGPLRSPGSHREAGIGPTALDAVAQHSPERRGARRAREPAADADDRDRLATLATTPVPGPLPVAARQVLAREESCQRVDRGIVIDERRGELAAEPLLELGRQPHGLERADAEAGERPADVDLVGPDSERAGDLRGQPGRDRVPGRASRSRPSLRIVRRGHADSGVSEGVGASGRVHSAMTSSEPARNASRQAWR